MTFSEICLEKILSLVPGQRHVKIHSCVRITVLPDWKAGLQNNNDQHILLVKSGVGKYIFDDQEIQLEKGKIVYISSGCPHYAWHDPKNPLVIVGLRFDFYDNITNKPTTLPCEPFYLSIHISNLEYYDTLCSSINNSYYFINKHSNQLLCSSLITFLLTEILIYHRNDQTKFNVQDGRIEKVQRYMTEDIAARTSIEELALRVNMSGRHLQSCFKKKYGISPKQYQLKIRMNHAKFLLEASDLSIQKISSALGYSDQFVFSRQFKNFFGIPPTSFRDGNR